MLFPETVAMKELIPFTWGAIFQDREAARFRRVVAAAAEITKLDLPDDARRLLEDQALTERAFVLWDLVHDRTHMRGDLPFDPFMIKQRMPYFLYSLEELRCDLTAFREAVRLVRAEDTDAVTREHAKLAQYAILFDRIFRFPLTGSRVRNYDGLGGQLLFAWLHQHHVLHWTDTSLAIDWEQLPDTVVGALGRDQRPLLGLDRPAEDRALARRLRPGPGDADAEPRLPLGPGPARRDPRRRAEGLHRRRAGRRVPALDVLRGARQEAPPHHRVDRGDHRHLRVTSGPRYRARRGTVTRSRGGTRSCPTSPPRRRRARPRTIPTTPSSRRCR